MKEAEKRERESYAFVNRGLQEARKASEKVPRKENRLSGQGMGGKDNKERERYAIGSLIKAPIILPRINPWRFRFLMTLTFAGRYLWMYSSSSPIKSSENNSSIITS